MTALAQAGPTATLPLRVYAAGSLREPLTEIARLYEAATGTQVELTLGASGLLRERIEQGELAQVFASADTQHPQTLASSGAQWQPPALFVRNTLCALTAPNEPATTDSLLARMLSRRADIFLTYCTNAISAQKEVPRLQVVAIPAALQVSASYGLTARRGDAAATGFAQYLLQPPAQAVFRKAGFAAP